MGRPTILRLFVWQIIVNREDKIFSSAIFIKNILYAFFLLLLGSLKQQDTVTARDCCKLLGCFNKRCGPGSSVGIATELRATEFDLGEDEIFGSFRPALEHPATCKMGTGSFPGVNYGQGVLVTTHSLLVPRSWKSRAIPIPTLWI